MRFARYNLIAAIAGVLSGPVLVSAENHERRGVDCLYDYPSKNGDTCENVAPSWGLSVDEFIKLNPGVICPDLEIGKSYCVVGKFTPDEPTNPPPQPPTQAPTTTSITKPTTSTSTSTSTQPSTTILTTTKATTTSGPTVSPIMSGAAANCDRYYKIQSGDGCDVVASKNGITISQLKAWNTEINASCSNLWLDYYVCVWVPGVTTPTTTAKTTTTADGGVQTPQPTQAGMVKNCNKFHLIKSTTTCASIQNYFNLPLSQFLEWNPAVGKGCTSLWADYYVCVGVEGYKPPTTTTTKPTTTTEAPGNGIKTPSPIQNNMVKNCDKFHLIKSTTTCASIESYYSLPLATFLSWNPAVGQDCRALLVNYYVCVGTVGWKPATTTTKAPTSTKAPSNGISTPTPIQPGMIGTCNKFHMVKTTTTCASIQDYYKITMAQIAKWNPAVGSTCNALWANYYVCVGIIGQTPTPSQPPTTNPTPSPIQPGMIKDCKKFHLVKKTTTCASIQNYYKITMAQIAKWNPAVGSACNALWADYYVCVGV